MAHASAADPKNFVISTGRQESVRRFIELGWGRIEWQGNGLDETGSRAETGEVLVRMDMRCFRLAELETRLGDPIMAKLKGLTRMTTLEELVAEMVDADREDAKKKSQLKRKGFAVVGSIENSATNPRAIKVAGCAA